MSIIKHIQRDEGEEQQDLSSLHTQSPYVHHTPWCAQYGRWNFFKDTGRVHWIG